MRYLKHPDVKPAIPPLTKFCNIEYAGYIVRRNIPSDKVYAMKAMLKKTGNYELGKLEVKQVN